MQNFKAIDPPWAAASVGAFSRAVRVGDLLYVAGTTALTHVPGNYYQRHLPPTIEEQTALTFDNIKQIMAAAGGTLDDVFKLVVMLRNPEEYWRFDAVRSTFFKATAPISTCFIARLVRDDVLVEVEAVANLAR